MQPRALLGLALAVCVLVVGVLAALVLLAPRPGATPVETPEARWAAPAAVPERAASPTSAGVAGLVDADWLATMAVRTGIPQRALAAYAGVAIAKAEQMPSCGLGWNTLAAVGYAESGHGSFGGASIGEDGAVSPAIIGIALDGGSTEVITDTDDGVIDGDAEHDRAVGPMQLIPQTWRNWHVDASGDGAEDPHNIDDAVMAAANYLCRSSGDMTTETGWRAGIAAYNSAPAYITKVAAAGTGYAAR